MASWRSNTCPDGRYLLLNIDEVVNNPANSSTLNWTLSALGGGSTYYSVAATTVTINGTQVYYKGRTDWSAGVFPALAGSTSGSLVVPHDADGTKTVIVGFTTSVYTNLDSPQAYGGYMTLTTIDRAAPTVSFTATDISSDSFRVSAQSSAACDNWQYSLDSGGAWLALSSALGTSAEAVVSSLSPNSSYEVKVKARKQSNQVYGESGAQTVKTLGSTVVNSVEDVKADAETVNISLNVTVFDASYTHTLEIKNGGSVYLTIENLQWDAGTADQTITLNEEQKSELRTGMKAIEKFTGIFALTTYSDGEQLGEVSSKTATVRVSPEPLEGAPLVSLRRQKVGINTLNPAVALDVNGDAAISGELTVEKSPMADFVTEQGTATVKQEGVSDPLLTIPDVTWFYRKWNSGLAECWGIAEVTFTGRFVAAGGWMSAEYTVPIPPDLFAAGSFLGTDYLVNITDNGNYTAAAAGERTQTHFQLNVTCDMDKNGLTTHYAAHLIGRWKE